MAAYDTVCKIPSLLLVNGGPALNIDEPKNTEESQDIQSDLQELSGAGETGPQSPTHPVDAMENDAASQGPGFTEQAAPANVPVAKKC